MERFSSRSKPRRFGMSSRKSVSACASSRAICRRACASRLVSAHDRHCRRVLAAGAGVFPPGLGSAGSWPGAPSAGARAACSNCRRCRPRARHSCSYPSPFASPEATPERVDHEKRCRSNPLASKKSIPIIRAPFLRIAYQGSMSALVAIIMGSQSDWATMRHAAETLDGLGVAQRHDRLRPPHAGSAVRVRQGRQDAVSR